MLSHLPLYDENGYRYEYFIEESPTSNIPVYEDGKDPLYYSLAQQDYSRLDGVTNPNVDAAQTSTLTNVYGEGTELDFIVEKLWKDDGDIQHREPITFGLFYVGPEDGSDVIDPNQPVLLLSVNPEGEADIQAVIP